MFRRSLSLAVHAALVAAPCAAVASPPAEQPEIVVTATRAAEPRVVMTNNFAFGGINTSLLLRTP